MIMRIVINKINEQHDNNIWELNEINTQTKLLCRLYKINVRLTTEVNAI